MIDIVAVLIHIDYNSKHASLIAVIHNKSSLIAIGRHTCITQQHVY